MAKPRSPKVIKLDFKAINRALRQEEHVPSYEIGYIQDALDHTRVAELLPVFVHLMKRYKFDAIAFRGMSGCLLAAPLSYFTRKPMIMVRKPDVSTHAYRAVEGDQAARSYIIVDDFVESGNTVRAITKAIKGFSGAKCIGVMLADEVGRWLRNNSLGSRAPFVLWNLPK